jgi:hypothetical protein
MWGKEPTIGIPGETREVACSRLVVRVGRGGRIKRLRTEGVWAFDLALL